MALLSLENAQGVDVVTYLVGFIVYLLIVWLPVAISAYLVRYYEPVTLIEFKYHWWKFKRQYIYLEIWFRTHVILGLSAWIVLLLEPWDNVTRVVYVFILIFICGLLGFVSRLVKARIPGSHKTKAEISGILVQHATARGNMHEFMRKATSRDGFSPVDGNATPAGTEMGQKQTSQDGYVQTNSTTEQTMKKQIEMAEQTEQ